MGEPFLHGKKIELGEVIQVDEGPVVFPVAGNLEMPFGRGFEYHADEPFIIAVDMGGTDHNGVRFAFKDFLFDRRAPSGEAEGL